MPGTNEGYLVQLQSPEGDNVYPVISADCIKSTDGETYDLPALKTQVDECFQSVSEGKTLIAEAVTDKGVETASDATFQQMAANIGQIETETPNLDHLMSSLSLGTSGYTPEAGVVWNTMIDNRITVTNGTRTYSTGYVVGSTGTKTFYISSGTSSSNAWMTLVFTMEISWDQLTPKATSVKCSVNTMGGDWGSAYVTVTDIDSDFIYFTLTISTQNGYTVQGGSSYESSTRTSVDAKAHNAFQGSITMRSKSCNIVVSSMA